MRLPLVLLIQSKLLLLKKLPSAVRPGQPQSAKQVEQAAAWSPEEPKKAAFLEQPKSEEGHHTSAGGPATVSLAANFSVSFRIEEAFIPSP
jgi:hypothetical protein